MSQVKLLLGDTLDKLSEMPDESVDCVITSPPYVGAPSMWGISFHTTNLLWARGFLYQVWDQCLRIVRPGGKLIINVANTKRRPYISNVYEIYKWNELQSLSEDKQRELDNLRYEVEILSSSAISGRVDDQTFEKLEKLHSRISPYMHKCEPLGEIIWNKGYGQGGTAWGSFRSPSDPSLADQHEYIVVLRKHGDRHRPDTFEKINTFDFKSWRNSIWNISPESAKSIGHIAPFPLEIPRRLITLYTFENETVLDPFIGSGTTALACEILNRNCIGIDHSPEYIKLAESRIANYRADKGEVARPLPHNLSQANAF